MYRNLIIISEDTIFSCSWTRPTSANRDLANSLLWTSLNYYCLHLFCFLSFFIEHVVGIEPTLSTWKVEVIAFIPYMHVNTRYGSRTHKLKASDPKSGAFTNFANRVCSGNQSWTDRHDILSITAFPVSIYHRTPDRPRTCMANAVRA